MTWRPRSVLNRTTPWAQRCSAPPQETWTTDSEPAGYSASRTQPLLDDPSGSSRSGSHARSLIGERDRPRERKHNRPLRVRHSDAPRAFREGDRYESAFETRDEGSCLACPRRSFLLDCDLKRLRSVGAQQCHSTSRRSEEHTSELQSRGHLVCRLLLEKKNKLRAQRCRHRTRRSYTS